MNLESCPGLEKVRLDTELQSFKALLDYYLDAPKRAKASSKKIVAVGPLMVPDVIYSAQALSYDIYTRETLFSMFGIHENLSQYAMDAGISPELSPWNLTMLGAVLGNQNALPIDMYCTTWGGYDDQVTKCFQLLANASSKPLRVWEVPRYDAAAHLWALGYLQKELAQLLDWLIANTGNKITEKELRESIHTCNLIRQDLVALDSILSGPQVALNAVEYSLIEMIATDFVQEPMELHSHLQQLLVEIQERIDHKKSAPGISRAPIRVYIAGDEAQDLRIYNAIEDYGGAVVGFGFRWPLYYKPVTNGGKPVADLADWIWHMPNNLLAKERVKAELEQMKRQKPDAVVVNSSVGSRHMPGMERLYRDLVKQELGVPVLTVETTLLGENTDKVIFQIQALLETMT